MNKKNRQLLIKKIVTENWIESQSQLLEVLANEGCEATQATISRDIKELRIVKIHESDGKIKYGILPETDSVHDRLKEVFKESVEKVTQVHFLNIINTFLGTANIVAAEIDELQLSEIVGTLAGTDTVVLISKSEEDAKVINERLTSYLN